MTYKKILWVEDNPEIIESVQLASKHFRSQDNLVALLDRITWAFDRESAMQSASENEYNLIILDADFPDKLEEQRRQYIKDWLRERYEGKKTDFEPLSRFSGEVNIYGLLWNLKENNTEKLSKPIKAPYAIGDNFAQLYAESLIQLQTPIVVLSSSLVAPDAAFCLKLPFYSKGIRTRKNEPPLMHKDVLDYPMTDREFLKTWEYGNIDVFIEKYLL